MKNQDIYNICYPLCKVYTDNSSAAALAKTIQKKLQRYIKTLSLSSSPHTGTTKQLSREDIIQSLMVEIQLNEGKEKLAFITELNKLEDNYKGKTDTEIHITIIDYKDAVIADTVKPSTLTQLKEITPPDTTEAKL